MEPLGIAHPGQSLPAQAVRIPHGPNRDFSTAVNRTGAKVKREKSTLKSSWVHALCGLWTGRLVHLSFPAERKGQGLSHGADKPEATAA